jgi:hypothetical protein
MKRRILKKNEEYEDWKMKNKKRNLEEERLIIKRKKEKKNFEEEWGIW